MWLSPVRDDGVHEPSRRKSAVAGIVQRFTSGPYNASRIT